MLIFEAHDQDTASSQLLGRAFPISLAALTQNEDANRHALDLFDQNYKHIGNVNIITQFIFKEVDPLPEKLSEMSMLELTIVQVDFLKDYDAFGSQDPFVTFLQGEQLHRSKTASNAGKHAEMNERFALREIYRELEANDEVTFQAFDEDVGDKAEFLGQTKPMPYRKFCQSDEKMIFTLDLFNKKERAGSIVI